MIMGITQKIKLGKFKARLPIFHLNTYAFILVMSFLNFSLRRPNSLIYNIIDIV